MVHTYIIYSTDLDRYYIGAYYESLFKRVQNHNDGICANSYTLKASDWALFLNFECSDYSHAVRLERKIKAMKSSRYIENLKKYPEMRSKIVERTKST